MTIGIVELPHYFPDGFFIDTTMENNYSVYQHVTPDGMYYFGQTNNIKRRWRNNGAEYKRTALQPYIEKFGWENIQHIILFRDQTKEDALFIENFLIETAREDGVCINKNRSGLVSKEEEYRQEYYEENKDKIKQYYEQNKQQIRGQKKQYYEQNKQQIREQQKQYYEQNKQQKREYQRQYYKRKKEEKQFKELGCLPLW